MIVQADHQTTSRTRVGRTRDEAGSKVSRTIPVRHSPPTDIEAVTSPTSMSAAASPAESDGICSASW